MSEVMSVKEVAEFLNINANSAYALVKREDFPSIRIGKRIIVPKESFYEWLNKEANKKKELESLI